MGVAVWGGGRGEGGLVEKGPGWGGAVGPQCEEGAWVGRRSGWEGGGIWVGSGPQCREGR